MLTEKERVIYSRGAIPKCSPNYMCIIIKKIFVPHFFFFFFSQTGFS